MHVSKERGFEHLNGVFFIGCGEKGYCVAEGGTGWEHWLYILIPIVYDIIFSFILHYFLLNLRPKPCVSKPQMALVSQHNEMDFPIPLCTGLRASSWRGFLFI